MSATVVGLALFAAILHASWNAFLRTGADRLWTVTVMSFSSSVRKTSGIRFGCGM